MRKVKALKTHLNVRKVIAFRTLFFWTKNGKEGNLITCKYFTYEDRKHFEEQYNAGAALPDIAYTLGVHIGTIYRELNRGSTGEIDANGRAGYDAELAQKTMPDLLPHARVNGLASCLRSYETGRRFPKQ